jgi:hypothetical protein
MMIVLVVIGTALDLTPTILIFAPVMLPIAVKAGIDPVYFGLMFVLNGAIGLITPPVGTVLNVVAGVGKLSHAPGDQGREPLPDHLHAADPRAVRRVPAAGHRAGGVDALTFFFLRSTTRRQNHDFRSSYRPGRRGCTAALLAPLPGRRHQAAPDPLRLWPQRGQQPGPRRAKFFAEQVEKASGGKMKVRAIGAAALGPTRRCSRR